jgi:hypothetical protein
VLGWMLRIPLGYWFFCVLEGRPFWPDPFLTMDALYQLSYVGLALAWYRRGVGSPRPTGAAALSRAGSSWREGVELVGECRCVQVSVVDEDGPEVLVHGERRGQVDRVHRA